MQLCLKTNSYLFILTPIQFQGPNEQVVMTKAKLITIKNMISDPRLVWLLAIVGLVQRVYIKENCNCMNK